MCRLLMLTVASLIAFSASSANALSIALPCTELGTDVTDGPPKVVITNKNSTLSTGTVISWTAPATSTSGSWTLSEPLKPHQALNFFTSGNLNGKHKCSASYLLIVVGPIRHP